MEDLVNFIRENQMPFPTTDQELINSYGYHINSAYPYFLKKLGLDRVAVKAEGAVITDSEGKEYIDCLGGYGICNLGHNHPELIQSITDQLNEKQLNTKPLITEIPVKLAKLLSEIAPGDLTCSFICNSGSEAIDSAIKLARLHTGKKEIICALNAFHGFTFGALSASGISSFKSLFEPLVPDFKHVPFGDFTALREVITDNTAAVLLEPVQHESGISLPPPEFFHNVQELCEQYRIILIIDEIKTGFGKTGTMFACDLFKISPDILVVGKSLGGGLIPVGGMIAKKNIWQKFGLSFPMSASSYGWNILACKVALTTIQILLRDSSNLDVQSKGRYLLNSFNKLAEEFPDVISKVSGLGLLIGVEIVQSQQAIKLSKELAKDGILAFPAFGRTSVLMIEPPLIITYPQIEKVIKAFKNSCVRLEDTC
jgi:putrescine aminotransferase